MYAPQKLEEKWRLLENLSRIISEIRGEPFVLIGDFNWVLHEYERQNCIYWETGTRDFGYFIQDNDRLDVLYLTFNLRGLALKIGKVDWLERLSTKNGLRIEIGEPWPWSGETHIISRHFCRNLHSIGVVDLTNITIIGLRINLIFIS